MTHDLTIDSACAFLRAGGVVGLREWVALDDATREALSLAGKRVMAEKAMALVLVMEGGAAELMGSLDAKSAEEQDDIAALNLALGGGL